MESGFHLYRLQNLLLCCVEEQEDKPHSAYVHSKIAGSKSKNKDKKGEKEAPTVADDITADKAEQVAAAKDREDKSSTADPDEQVQPDNNGKDDFLLNKC